MIKNKLKSLASDTMIYGVFQTSGRFLSYLLVPLYSNYLSQAENGIVAYLFAIIAIIQFVYGFGMETAFFRFFEKGQEEHNRKVFSAAFFTIFTISLFFTLLMVIYSSELSVGLIGDIPGASKIFLIAALIPMFDMLIATSYAKLRMEHKAKRFAVTRFFIIFISVCINVIFLLFTRLGALGVFLAQLVASLIGILIFLPSIIRSFTFRIDINLLKNMLYFGLPTLPASLSSVAMQMLDRPIMKFFLTDADVGVYQINAKLAVPMMMVVSIFDYAWKPFYLSNYSDAEAPRLFGRVLTYFTLVCAIVFLVVTLFVDNIVRIPLWGGRYFVSPEYWHAMYIVPIILLGYFFSGVTNNFAAVFHISKKTKYLPLAITVSAIASIILNLILIPIFGFIGASISLLIAYFLSMFLMKIYQNNVDYKIFYEWRRIVLILVSTAIVFIAGYIIKSFNSTELIDTSLLSSEAAFFIKILLLIIFVVLLKILGFFSKSELLFIKNFLYRKKL